jgi:hypothetical protein
MTLKEEWFAYVAFPQDCRCLAAVHVDEPDHRKDVAKFTADQIKRGHLVERISGSDFKVLPWRCPEHPEGRW